MNDAATRHRRRSLRLPGCDYAQAGAYFVTLCTQHRACLFGNIVHGEMQLNEVGKMIHAVWHQLPTRFDTLALDEFVVMPNHSHGILVLQTGDSKTGDHKDHPNMVQNTTRPRGTLPDTVGRRVQAFKSITTHAYIRGVKQHGWLSFAGRLWQRNYWEHIVRNESAGHQIRAYIHNNPAKWSLGQLNPQVM